MIDARESRDTIINVCRKGRNIRVERIQKWRAGFDLSYEIFVDNKCILGNLKPEDVIRYLGSVLEDS